MKLFELADYVAVTWFLAAMISYSLVTRSTYWDNAKRVTLMSAAQENRLSWMCAMARRSDHFVDVYIQQSFSSGIAFFGSTTVVVIGVLIALLGAQPKVQALIAVLPFARKTSEATWELQILFVITIFVYSFFKFVWAFRLSQFTALMIAATPQEEASTEEHIKDHIRRTAELSGLAAKHANSGFRGYYFGMASMTWIVHPLALILSSTLVLLILYRREHKSYALQQLSRRSSGQ